MTDLANKLVLSIFPGIDLLGRAFEEAGFCIVRGPDLIWGGDVTEFHPPSGHFWGIIGGPPCQDFSSLRRSEVTGNGLAMMDEFRRIVTEAEPEWWLMENVSRVPDMSCGGYYVQRLDVDLKWWCDCTRLRHIHFGSRSGRMLHVDRCVTPKRDSAGPVTFGENISVTTQRLPGAATANDSRPFAELCRLQGLPEGFDLPGFKADAKKRAVGNGVPLAMGRALARAVTDSYTCDPPDLQLQFDGKSYPLGKCACGCGRGIMGKKRYYDFSCRKRAQRRRDRARSHLAQSLRGV